LIAFSSLYIQTGPTVVILCSVCVCVLWEDYRVKYTTHVEQALPPPNIPPPTHRAFT